MSYTPTVFVDDSQPAISAFELNKIGQGIATAQQTAESALAAGPDIRVQPTEPTADLTVGTVWIAY